MKNHKCVKNHAMSCDERRHKKVLKLLWNMLHITWLIYAEKRPKEIV